MMVGPCREPAASSATSADDRVVINLHRITGRKRPASRRWRTPWPSAGPSPGAGWKGPGDTVVFSGPHSDPGATKGREVGSNERSTVLPHIGLADVITPREGGPCTPFRPLLLRRGGQGLMLNLVKPRYV